jgi:hypothetical protein
MSTPQKILPSITTHGRTTSSWPDKIGEIQHLGLTEVALFLTGLSAQDRAECFRLLDTLLDRHAFSIPFVHAIAEMPEEDYLFLMQRFGTRQFNLHPASEFPLQHPLRDSIRECIAIENNLVTRALTEADIEGFNGICLDLSHLEDLRLGDQAEFAKMQELLDAHPIRVNHASAVWEFSKIDLKGFEVFHRHVSRSPEDMSYLRAYPRSYFAPFCAIELENSLSDQMGIVRAVRTIVDESL